MGSPVGRTIDTFGSGAEEKGRVGIGPADGYGMNTASDCEGILHLEPARAAVCAAVKCAAGALRDIENRAADVERISSKRDHQPEMGEDGACAEVGHGQLRPG